MLTEAICGFSWQEKVATLSANVPVMVFYIIDKTEGYNVCI